MPVVRLDFDRLSKMTRSGRKTILARLPFLGLDIEGTDRESVRVEYSPNRPDFGSDFGIARGLRGLLGKEIGLPQYQTTPSGISVAVDPHLTTVRPYIACATVTGLRLNDEDVRQIISLQEDLHNGLGRKRRRVAIGLHDLDKVSPPFSFEAVPSTFSFRALGSKSESSIWAIIRSTEEGKAYGGILAGSKLYPVITDSKERVLSFPPVINGSVSKVSMKTKNMFIDVTSTDMKAGDDVLAIMATTLAEAGGKIGSVLVRYPKNRKTPDLSPIEIPLDRGLVQRVLGLDLDRREIIDSLRKSRLEVRGNMVRAARYRVDMLHPVDVAEEVALGYGVDRIRPIYPASMHPGSFNRFEQFLDSVSTVMAGAGMIELMTYELADEQSMYRKFGRSSEGKISVQNPKSLEHSVLRDSLLPSLMATLSTNVKAEYPQRVYEVGRVYERGHGRVEEAWHLGCLVAHSQANYSEAKMYLESASRTAAGVDATTDESYHWAFAPGRSASIKCGGEPAGSIGEMRPESISAFGLGVPVAGFELNLCALYKQLK